MRGSSCGPPSSLPLPGLHILTAVELNRSGKSHHFQSKITVFPELKIEWSLWIQGLERYERTGSTASAPLGTLPSQMAGTTNSGAQESGISCKLCVRNPLHPPKVDLFSARNRFLTPVSHQFQDSADSCLSWHHSAVRRTCFWLPSPESVPC